MVAMTTKKELSIRVSLILVMAIALTGGYFYLYHREMPEIQDNSPQIYLSDLTKEKLDKSIALSASYLVNACSEQGKFLYRINLDPTVEVKPKYNILRHAGAVYALAMYAGRSSDKKVRDALQRSARFLIEKTIRPIPGQDDLLAIWSPAKICGRKGSDKVKLGGTGLGLLALIEAEKIIPGIISLEDLSRLGRFILFMQKSDGSFYSKYIQEKGGRDDSWTSLYYPGEAALGLMMLYEKAPSPEWLQGAADAMAYLSRLRYNKIIVEADHWALIATAKLLKHYDRSNRPVPKETIVQHGVKICRSMLTGVPRYHEESSEYGALTESGFTTQTAIRLEGLLAAISFLPEKEKELTTQIVSAVQQGLVFLLRSQVKKGEYAGGIPRIAQALAFKNTNEGGSNKDREYEIRIDYVQHAMCAMMQYTDNFL